MDWPATSTGFSRRQLLRAGVGGVAGLYLAGCGGDTAAEGEVDALYEMTYVGPPGTVADFWRGVREDLRGAGSGAQLGQLQETPFEALFQKVETQARAKSGATLFTWYADHHTFREYKKGNLTAVQTLVPEDELKHWLLRSTEFDGKVWGSSETLEIAILVINRQHFDTAGIDVDVEFESYDAFIEACDRLKAAGITPIEAGTSDGFNAEKWLYFLQFQVCENPADLLGGLIGEVPLDAPVFAYPRTQIPILRDEYMNEDPQNDTEEIATRRFLQGSAGMMLMYTHPIFAPGVGSEFEVIGFPKSPARFNRPAVGTANVLNVASYGENQKAAGEIIEFLHRPEQLATWWDLTRSLPGDNRFDASVLPATARSTWDLVTRNEGDPFAIWWPGNFFPGSAFGYQYGVTQDQFAGAGPDEALETTEQVFERFRDEGERGIEIVQANIDALNATLEA